MGVPPLCASLLFYPLPNRFVCVCACVIVVGPWRGACGFTAHCNELSIAAAAAAAAGGGGGSGASGF